MNAAAPKSVASSALPLPDPLDPNGWICVQLQIPNSRDYMAAFLGALTHLGQWRTYQRDLAHSARTPARLWKIAHDSVQFLGRDCARAPTIVESDYKNMPEFRTVCDGDQSFIEWKACTCPETWQRLAPTTIVPPAGQPPPSGTTPAPGEQQQYCFTMLANQVLRMTPIVNTGDTITLNSAEGQWWDGGELNWRCPDGDISFGPACVPGSGTVDSGDPVPTANHMSILVVINTTPYSLTIGTPFTVPSGITNQPISLQVNDSAIVNNSGSANVCVTVKNNAVAAWSHTFDFTLSTGGWIVYNDGSGDRASWSPGIGWISGGFNDQDVYIVRAFSSTNITRIVAVCTSVTSASGADGCAEFYGSTSSTVGTQYFRDDTKASSPGGTLDHSGPVTTTGIGLFAVANNATLPGQFVWTSCTVYGTGTDPF